MSKVSYSLPESYDLFVGGDFCPAYDKQNALLQIGNDLRVLLAKAELRCLNLECPITNHSIAIAKTGPAIKALPATVKLLEDLNIDVCNLANNHILDFGYQGATDTQTYLQAAKLSHTGLSLPDEYPVLIKEIRGKKIAFVSFTENEFSTLSDDGLRAVPLDCYTQVKQMQQARQSADYVIVQYHGGVEQYSYPTPGQLRYARFMAELGASAVICHHSHCVSGYEIYNDVPIFYGLGNLYFPEEGNPAGWFQGLALCISLEPYFNVTVVPVKHDLASGTLNLNCSDRDDVIATLDNLNVTIESDVKLISLWKKFCFGSEYSTLSLVFKQSRILRFLTRRGVLRNNLNRKLSLGFYNLIRCESHREKLLETVKRQLRI